MLVPWNLGAPHLQEWARKNLPKDAKQSLIEIVDQMKDVDGLTLLDECVCFVESKAMTGALAIGTEKHWRSMWERSKYVLARLTCCVHVQSFALNAQVAGALKTLLSIFDPDQAGYMKALLLSCVFILML